MGVRHISAYIQSSNFNDAIDLDIEHKPYKNKVVLTADFKDMAHYIEHIKQKELSKSVRYLILDRLSNFKAKRREIPRKKPESITEEMECVMQQIYNVFSSNARYFNIDNQILLPILRDKITKDEELNKYVKIK
jgi:hypothetical protein